MKQFGAETELQRKTRSTQRCFGEERESMEGEGREGDESERGQQGSKEREAAPKQQLITVKNAKAPK